MNFIELEENEVMLHFLKQLTYLMVISSNVQYDMTDGWTRSELFKSILVVKFLVTDRSDTPSNSLLARRKTLVDDVWMMH